jgi:predicted kinase
LKRRIDLEQQVMKARHLIIVCGVPGAGKSTLAHRMVDRWGAVSFASETFADELGAAGRTSAGDLTKEAIAHAYSAMGAAVTAALATGKLVIAVGSFRAEDQRRRFRDIARSSSASVTTLRVVCPVEMAAERVRARIALGERGPTETAIRQIDAVLSQASDIDVVLTNDSSIEHFHRLADGMIEGLRSKLARRDGPC